RGRVAAAHGGGPGTAGKGVGPDRVAPARPAPRQRPLRDRASPAALAARDAVPEVRRAARRAALSDEVRLAVLREPQERHDGPATGNGGSLRHALSGSTPPAGPSHAREPPGRGGWGPPPGLPPAGGRGRCGPGR